MVSTEIPIDYMPSCDESDDSRPIGTNTNVTSGLSVTVWYNNQVMYCIVFVGRHMQCLILVQIIFNITSLVIYELEATF